MIHAEELVIAVQRGTATTGWRDFADIYLLAAGHDSPAGELQSAIARLAAHLRQCSHRSVRLSTAIRPSPSPGGQPGGADNGWATGCPASSPTSSTT